ncbi:MAG TPA: cytochrome P450 [Puia sp.]|nr:cytochrome P450 [Puia sp.]
MDRKENDLTHIRFRKDFSYAKKTPTFVSNAIGASDEIARWVLDWNDVLYKDEPHAPALCTPVMNRLIGDGNTGGPGPVLIRTDALLYTTESVIVYFEQRCAPEKRLLPADAAKRQEVVTLYNLFTGPFEGNVYGYLYGQLLANPGEARSWFTQGVPFGEKLQYMLSFGALRKELTREWGLAEKPAGERLAYIKKIFGDVDTILSDGRRYLTGDRLTIADIAFAAVAAPLLLPIEFGGAIGAIHTVPTEMRREVEELRATPAGQYVLLLYQDERPLRRSRKDIPKDPGPLGKLGLQLGLALDRKKTGLFCFLQKHFPVLRLGIVGLAAVCKNDLLVEMMERDNDFTVEEINGKKMANQKGAFFLGFDRNNPQFDRERNFVRRTAKKEDMDRIRSFIRDSCEQILRQARSYGKVDVADSMCYTVLVRFIDDYFGVPPPTEPIMRHWLRVLFYDLFLNFTNDAVKHQEAVSAALDRRVWVLQLIRDRRRDLDTGKTLADNVLNRMILLQREEGNGWFDDETIQRNIGGLITGILETTNKAVVLVLDELFNRPDVLKGAIDTAQIKDMKKMYGYVSEALRFNPAQPGVIRYCESGQVLKGKGTKPYRIKAKRKVFALTACAMMDPAVFPEPRQFNPQREAVYMNYGYALHECYGKYINAVTISEFVAAVLRLPGIRREPGWAGRGTGLHVGPFFNNFVVRFDTI